MCSCVENLEKRMVDEQPVLKDRLITNATLQNQVWLVQSAQIVTSSIIELKVEGRKSPVKQNVIHSYCPFCGSPYNKEKEVESC